MKVKEGAGRRFLLTSFLSLMVVASFGVMADTEEEKDSDQEENKSLVSGKITATTNIVSTEDFSEVFNDDGSYQIRKSGDDFGRVRQSNHLIQLQGGRSFDPLKMSGFAQSQRAAATDTRLYEPSAAGFNAYIVQFHTQALPTYQEAINKTGATVTIAIPPNAMIVLMDSTLRPTIEAFPFVRATADFLPAYKLEDGLETVIASASNESQIYSIMTVTKNHRNALMDFVRSIGADIIGGEDFEPLMEGSRFSAKLTAQQLLQVSQQPQTLFIDVRGEEGEDLDQVREREGFNYVETVAGYCGKGVGLEIYDRGYRLSHQELVNQPILVRSPAASTGSGGLNHGTEISGILFAKGVAMVKGLVHCAARPIVFSRYSGFPSNHQPVGEAQLRSHLAPLVDPNGLYRAVVQTSSTDYVQTTSYTTWSAEYDEVLFDLDFVKLQSQSNKGNRKSRPAAWAKNVVAVGGFGTSNTVDRSDDSWGRASIGPANDDRIKPDLSGQYGGIRTIDDVSNSAYRDFGGTSGATPTVAGAFGIMFEMWADGVFDGGPGKNRDVFTVRPHAATAKALMIHSAYRYAFTGGDSANMSRVHQGWGSPDLKNLYDTAKANGWGFPILVNEDDIVTPGSSNSYTLTVDGTQPIKATMVYSDLRGNPSAALQRINDLSLKLTSPTGTVYWGNNGLRNGNWSTPNGTSNTRDTTENVFIQAPEAGTWTIEVFGDDIVQDGHPDTSAVDAVYALLATGGTSSTFPTNQAPVVNAGVDQTVDFPNAANLNGRVTDDGLPAGSVVTAYWSKVSGPGTVTFNPSSSAITNATFSAAGNYVLRLTANDGAASNSDDVNVTVSAGGSMVLESQTFEAGQGNWMNVSAGDNQDWTRGSGITASSSTGPDRGSNGSSWYMYLETSDGKGAYNAGDSAILEGPSIAGSSRTLTFDYHMFGSNIGTLYVDVQRGGVWTNSVWSISGQQHSSESAAYSSTTVNLGAFSGTIKVRFRAVAAGGWRGDMAIDNIEIKGVGAGAQ